MKVVIIKYNAGNILSVSLALQRLGIQAEITHKKEKILQADKVIFPGVGEASSAMAYLKNIKIDAVLSSLKQPFLGICLGLQLLCQFSEENNTECLGIFDETVKKFPPSDKVPHMGWNSIEFDDNNLFKDLDPGSYVYFVHSYYATVGIHTIAGTKYILPFSSALQKDNFYAVQFHPEKSGRVGEQILRNFLAL
jgi:glutamine amidotransferase